MMLGRLALKPRCAQRGYCTHGGIFHPTNAHKQIRETIAEFSRNEVAPQVLQRGDLTYFKAREHDAKELFNRPLFNKLGELGMLGLTVPEKYGGSGLDATSVVIVHEEMSTADPA
jgi:isovaleryl-CoA dehydrogenase